jgi:hypothetical protein
MTTPNKDGWITHDGGPCPAPGTFTERDYGYDAPFYEGIHFGTADGADWAHVKRYRIFVPAHTATPGPSPFVRKTAARIMAALMTWRPEAGHPALAQDAVAAAMALEAALEEAGE